MKELEGWTPGPNMYERAFGIYESGQHTVLRAELSPLNPGWSKWKVEIFFFGPGEPMYTGLGMKVPTRRERVPLWLRSYITLDEASRLGLAEMSRLEAALQLGWRP